MVNYTYIIREAKHTDAEKILGIMKSSFKNYEKNCKMESEDDHAFKIDALKETTKDIEKDIETKTVFIAEIDNIAVGTIRIKLLDNKTAYISRFGVVPEYHNIGIGKSIMNIVFKFLASKNIKSAYLYTASRYTDLVRFYYGRGFYVDSTTTDRGYIRAKMVKRIT
jgi:ribosomal protein S18 acetylase RimI-like enzyme